jgi:hypothetical protein
LFGKCLPQTGCDAKLFLGSVNGWQVSQFPGKFFSLPKQVNKILHDIVALKQELTHNLGFSHIQVIQVNSGCALHQVLVFS